ncbi:unnamed protein product [Ilex paraguariensis]|uniref:Transcription repressor n=1 Tax=Ilex paraguariensis TaxID=185542 RepID=A0ABC8TMJ5_9AQUA
MENRFKLRIPSMFCSSFGSCRSKNISDVIERPALAPQNRQHYQLIELFSPRKPRSFPSICRPKDPERDETEHSCIVNKNLFPRSKVSDRHSLLVAGDGRKCPPVSPISFYEFKQFEANPKAKRTRRPMKKKTHLKSKNFDSREFGSCKNNGWFSSDEDDDKTTLFSSKSLSSDSSDSLGRNKPHFGDNSSKYRHRIAARKESERGLIPVIKGKVKDSFPVVKRSTDPYNDFRTSMVEMIIEKQIFAAKDLENLLHCFLSLNSYHHHKIIVEVFSEILGALFSDRS